MFVVQIEMGSGLCLHGRGGDCGCCARDTITVAANVSKINRHSTLMIKRAPEGLVGRVLVPRADVA